MRKEYKYFWNNEYYLIHVQFDTSLLNDNNNIIFIDRVFEDKSIKTEKKIMSNNGFRFIISRTCPEETNIIIRYSEYVTMKLFLIDDRAYYPTEAFYIG